MKLLLLFIIFNFFAPQQDKIDCSRGPTPSSPYEKMQLSVKKNSFNLGEPIYFDISLKNGLDTPVKAHFDVPNSFVYYKTKNKECNYQRFKPHWIGHQLLYCTPPTELAPGESWSGQGRIFFFGGDFALSEPGDYELFAVVLDINNSQNRFESNLVTVTIKEPPEKEREALKALRDPELGSFLEGNYRLKYGKLNLPICKVPLGDIAKGGEKAIAFIQKYPDSFYTPIVKRFFSAVMKEIASESPDRLTEEQKVLLDIARSY